MGAHLGDCENLCQPPCPCPAGALREGATWLGVLARVAGRACEPNCCQPPRFPPMPDCAGAWRAVLGAAEDCPHAGRFPCWLKAGPFADPCRWPAVGLPPPNRCQPGDTDCPGCIACCLVCPGAPRNPGCAVCPIPCEVLPKAPPAAELARPPAEAVVPNGLCVCIIRWTWAASWLKEGRPPDC